MTTATTAAERLNADPVPVPLPFPRLTPKQEAFARHYAASGNGAASARAAGYAPASAKQAAWDALESPRVRARIEQLREAHAHTLRGEAAVVLDRLAEALDLAAGAADYRAMLDILRLQAQIAGLAGPGATDRRALLHDDAGGPGPLARIRHHIGPHEAVDADAFARRMGPSAREESAADEAERAQLIAARQAGAAADPDFSLPNREDRAGRSGCVTRSVTLVPPERGGTATEQVADLLLPEGKNPDVSLPIGGGVAAGSDELDEIEQFARLTPLRPVPSPLRGEGERMRALQRRKA